MISKIRFRYSQLYDNNYRGSNLIQESLKKKGLEYPTHEKIRDFIKEVEPKWNKIEEKVLSSISKISGLKWKEKQVWCYVIGCGRSFSDPLTVKVHETKEDFIDTLVHEMIHQIQIQNEDIVNKNWGDYLYKNYPKETRVTRNHLIVHAIHKEIYLKIFGKKRLIKDIKESQASIDYKKSWGIVGKNRHKNIIKQFRKAIKNKSQ